MKKNILIQVLFIVLATFLQVRNAEAENVEQVAPGIWKITFGTPDAYTPCRIRTAPMKDTESFERLVTADKLPFDLREIRCRITSERTVLRIPCADTPEDFYGFGLDPDCFLQNGLIKRPKVCDRSEGDPQKKRGPGAGHAPVPLYFSTAGYGVYVDVARVVEFHMARLQYNRESSTIGFEQKERDMLTLEGLYEQKSKGKDVMVDIPGAQGVDVYLFAGPDIKTAVQRWILFSGGGAVPALWGLGVQLGSYNGIDAPTMLSVCDDMRAKQIPCDILVMEPKWQSHAYPCSFAWSKENFPDPPYFVSEVKKRGFKLALWEHSYIDSSAPFYKEIQPYTGSVLSMSGLVLDPQCEKGVRIYQDYHEQEFIKQGINAFKIDECDRSTIKTAQGWSFPNLTEFPSGIDGEQMGQTYGYLLQRNMLASFRKYNKRTFGNARASGALAAPLPFALYSDTYSLTDYIRQLCNASFSGLLWAPEFRDAPNIREFQRRMVVTTFSHLHKLNPYYNKLPLWQNYKVTYGNKNPLPLSEEEQIQAAAILRYFGNLRMRFIPYLYTAYREYAQTGIPPIRALVLDFPDDPRVRQIDDSYMFGADLLIAPFLFHHENSREVYLPAGTDWFEFSTGKRYEGGRTITVQATKDAEGMEYIPIFVRANSLIPMAEPVPYVDEDTVFDIRVRAYGENPRPFCLYEDDGVSFDFEKGVQNTVMLRMKGNTVTADRSGTFKEKRYRVSSSAERFE